MEENWEKRVGQIDLLLFICVLLFLLEESTYKNRMLTLSSIIRQNRNVAFLGQVIEYRGTQEENEMNLINLSFYKEPIDNSR